MSAPPPPPPHGESPKSTAGSSGLPPGKYDIFIIPPHSSGSGFLYLPSLKPNVNSFAAGFATACLCILVSSAIAPAVKLWWNSIKGAGGSGMILLIIGVGVGSWALGRLNTEGGGGNRQGGDAPGGFPSGFGGGYGGASSSTGGAPNSNGYAGAQNGYAGAPPGAGPMPGAGSANGGPKSSWQRGAPPPGTAHAEADPNFAGGASESARRAWEKAREDTKRKEEERKAREAERRRKEELEKKLREAREREAREREEREREAQARRKAEEDAKEARRKEAEAQELRKKEEEALEKKQKERELAELRLKEALEKKRKERELAELRLKEAREREARERDIQEKRKQAEEARAKRLAEYEARNKKRKEEEAAKKAAEQAAEKAAEKAAEELSKPRGSTYAFSAMGEKTNPWPKGRPSTPPATSPRRPPAPTAQTYRGADDDRDAHSYRPYDKKPTRKNSFNSSYSQSSYAASQTTSHTTPPMSHRVPYTTKDPNKIVIKAVYAFNNAFLKTPTSQLVAGVGSVTNGLVLNITTEGLFIDDDIRSVPQREWDVKAWTMKLVEVWCPSFRVGANASPRGAPTPQQKGMRRLWGLDKEKPATAEETDALVASMLTICKDNCRVRASSSGDSAYGSVNGAAEDRDRGAGLHILRASIRDQEGKKYVFVVSEEESWKLAAGLMRLRKGTQVRALVVAGMGVTDAKGTLDHLGWG